MLRASETEIMVGAVGKHSRRMEYPKIPENILGIQVTFTYSVNNGWVKFQKQLSETIACTQPFLTIHWHLICFKKSLAMLMDHFNFSLASHISKPIKNSLSRITSPINMQSIVRGMYRYAYNINKNSVGTAGKACMLDCTLGEG